jgi:hypothetical protein
MKKCLLAEPKVAAGVSETYEVKLLRSLRACSKHLLKSGEGVVEAVSILEPAWYPAGSRVANANLTAEMKESHQPMVPGALETLAQIERDVLEQGVLIAKIRQDLTQRETRRTHNQLLRQMGLEEIDDRPEPMDDEDDDS